MWRATFKSLLARKVRLALTALAVVLGVAFVAGTFVLTDTINHTFDTLFAEVNKGVAVEVHVKPSFGNEGGKLPDTLLPIIKAVPGVRLAAGSVSGYAQILDKKGKAATSGGAPTFGFNWVDAPGISPLTIKEGRAPRAPNEVGIDAVTARKDGYRPGDSVRILFQGPPGRFTVVGIIGFGAADNLGGATIAVFDTATAQRVLDSPGKFNIIDVAAADGVSPAVLRDRIAAALPAGHSYEALTGADASAKAASDVKSSLGFFKIALLVFAGIALFVGAFIIFNTFSIIVAQRTRELALLRALGASSAQVTRSVMAEAVVVGLFASAVGIGVGVAVAIGLQALLKGFGIDLPGNGIVFLPRTIWVSLLLGTTVTFVSSVNPARRASRVPPVAAMRDDVTLSGEGRSTRRRTVFGGIVTGLGVLLLALGLFAHVGKGIVDVGFGAALVFVGVAMLSPLFARPVAAAIGAPFARFGISARLGRQNAVRNPRRTASTAAALMIGLALVTFVSILASSITTSTSKAIDAAFRADFILSTDSFTGFSPAAVDQLRRSSSVAAVEEFRAGEIRVRGGSKQLTALDPAVLGQVLAVKVTAGSFATLDAGGVVLFDKEATNLGVHMGDTIAMQFAQTGVVRERVVGIYTGSQPLSNYVVSLTTFEHNFTEQLDNFAMVKAAPGKLPELKTELAQLGRTYPNIHSRDNVELKAQQKKQIQQLLGLISALLGLAILIALFGIVNTLALSVFERTHEIGLLRAVGMSRRQVRSMIRWESVIIAVFGAVLGIVVGVFFGVVMVLALRSQGITTLAIPGRTLLQYVIEAALAGVFAASGPARRAAKLDVLNAIATT
jgi:putative ABC transport system permease protein